MWRREEEEEESLFMADAVKDTGAVVGIIRNHVGVEQHGSQSRRP